MNARKTGNTIKEENNSSPALFSEFKPVTTEAWENQIQKDLKGADYTKKLIWKTSEGFDVRPYYRERDRAGAGSSEPAWFPFIRGNSAADNDWEIREDITVEDVARANEQALHALNRGVSAIGFSLDSIVSDQSMQRLLNDIILDIVSVHFLAGEHSRFTAHTFYSEAKRQHLDPAVLRGSFDYDPMIHSLLTGGNSAWAADKTADYLSWTRQHLPQFRAMTVNAQHFHDSGATTVQELAFALAAGNEYLSQLTEHGLAADDVCRHMQFTFAVGTNYFFEIAKIRAARLLWATIVDQYHPASVDSARMYIHAVSSSRSLTVYDPYVNILRNTTEAMSAGIAGVNSMLIKPFDAAYQPPGAFSTRIARNIQLILKHESYLNKVIDPAGGAYYVEQLTDSIARGAWTLFQEIEKNGGFTAACKVSFIQDKIEESARRSDMNIALRREILLGTNQYPNPGEEMLDKIEEKKGIALEAQVPPLEIKTLKPYRPAAAFEQLRMATEKHVKKGNKKPNVFLLSIGNLAMARARAGFSSNFFGCAGFEIIEYPLFNSLEEALDAVGKHQPDLVVLCSSDDAYEQLVEPLCQKLLGRSVLIVAGNPGEKTEVYKKYGIADFIHMGSNVLETLKGFQKKLKIA